jgi:hypothetical protein
MPFLKPEEPSLGSLLLDNARKTSWPQRAAEDRYMAVGPQENSHEH